MWRNAIDQLASGTVIFGYDRASSAKAKIDEEDDGEDVAAAGEFQVTKEEMSIIRAELACKFPDDYTYLR